MTGSSAKRFVFSRLALPLITCLAGCSSVSPTAPAFTAATDFAAGPSGETLKIGAPTPQAPINGVQLQTPTVFLTFAGVVGKYSPFVPGYQIELRDAAGALVTSAALGNTTYLVSAILARDTVYTWRVRAAYDGAFGPWSASATFRTSRP